MEQVNWTKLWRPSLLLWTWLVEVDGCSLLGSFEQTLNWPFSYYQNSPNEAVFKSVVALEKLFKKLIKRGKLIPSAGQPKDTSSQETPDARLKKWLKDNYRKFQQSLLNLLKNKQPTIQIASLEALMNLLKAEAEQTTSLHPDHPSQFDNDGYSRIFLAALVDNPSLNEHLLDRLVAFVTEYDDVRYYSFGNVAQFAKNRIESKKAPASAVVDDALGNALFAILTASDTPIPSSTAEITTFWALSHPKKPTKTVTDPSAHKRAFSQAWLSFLRLQLTGELHKKLLLVLDRMVIPNMVDPNLLIDYLTESVDSGGLFGGYLATGHDGCLTEIFILLGCRRRSCYSWTERAVYAPGQTQSVSFSFGPFPSDLQRITHPLPFSDYPDFYKRLYALFDDNVMHVKYRPRFFRLVDLFLSSTHLPSYLVASFIKRMSRLLLTAPTHAIIAVIPLLYNLLRRHPACMVLIHRGPSTESPLKDGQDPYNHAEPDPAKSNALVSSLWEVASLETHYHHAVASLAKLFRDKMDKPEYPLDSFLEHTSGSMIKTELSRMPKGNVPMEFEVKDKLFDGDEWADWEI